MRTTDELIEGIADVDATISLTPFITVANEIVTEICEPLGYSSSRLVLIETWLAAHFYAVRDPRIKTQSADIGIKVSATFEGQSAMGLNFTRYGQQAMMLDTLGGLARWQASMAQGRPVIQLFSLRTALTESNV